MHLMVYFPYSFLPFSCNYKILFFDLAIDLLAFRLLCALLPSCNLKGEKGGRKASHEIENYLIQTFKV